MVACRPSKSTDSLSLSNEQIAVDFFVDNFLRNRPKLDTTEGTYFSELERLLLDSGLLYGKKVFADRETSLVSRPYYDEYSLLYKDTMMDDKLYARSVDYIRDYNRKLKSEPHVLEILYPKEIQVLTLEEYRRLDSNDLFLQVRRSLSSIDETLVEIHETNGKMREFSILIFMDNNHTIKGWTVMDSNL